MKGVEEKHDGIVHYQIGSGVFYLNMKKISKTSCILWDVGIVRETKTNKYVMAKEVSVFREPGTNNDLKKASTECHRVLSEENRNNIHACFNIIFFIS